MRTEHHRNYKVSVLAADGEKRKAFSITVNQGQAYAPGEILERPICIDGDIWDVLKQL